MSGDVSAQLQLQNRAVFDHRKRATSNLPHKVTFRQNRNYESGLGAVRFS
jgi:hypothetical protein